MFQWKYFLGLSFVLLAGCVPDSSSTSDPNVDEVPSTPQDQTQKTVLSGKVVDDYLVGSSVTIKLGQSASSDIDETAQTDATGQFDFAIDSATLTGWNGVIYAQGGFNQLTAEDFNSPLKVQLNSEQQMGQQAIAITPMTTLLTYIAQSKQSDLAQCLLDSSATSEALKIDFIATNKVDLTLQTMKLQKSIELIQVAVQQGLSDIALVFGNELEGVDERINLLVLADLIYQAYASQLLQVDLSVAACSQTDPLSLAITNETTLNEVNLDSIFTDTQDTSHLKDKLSLTQPLTLQSLTPLASNASKLHEVLSDLVAEFDQAKLQLASLNNENILLAAELMKDQGAQKLRSGEGNLALAASILMTEAVERDEVDYSALTNAITEADPAATSYETVSEQAVLRLAFAEDLTQSYTKLLGNEQSIALYFFADKQGYACIAELSDLDEKGKLLAEKSALSQALSYELYKPNGMLINVQLMQGVNFPGKWSINRVSDQADADIKSLIDTGDGISSYLTSPNSTYFTLTEDTQVNYDRLSLVSFSDMAQFDSLDEQWVNLEKQQVDCAQIGYLTPN